MSITEAISLVAMILLAGGVASRLVELIKGARWSARAKWLLSVALSAAVGLATAWLAGDVLGLRLRVGIPDRRAGLRLHRRRLRDCQRFLRALVQAAGLEGW